MRDGLRHMSASHRDTNSQFSFSCDEVLCHPVHGVMLGRAVYNNPLMLACADSVYFGIRDPLLTRRQVMERYICYCEYMQSSSGPRKVTAKYSQMVSTSILMKPVHSVMNSLHHASMYKQTLNDIYIDRVKAGEPNPSCRDIVSDSLYHSLSLCISCLSFSFSCFYYVIPTNQNQSSMAVSVY